MSKLRTGRKAAGAVLCLHVLAVGFLVCAGIFLTGYSILLIRSQKAESASQAAALQAACEVSRLIFQDPQWGYVGLSDYPACGSQTVAEDGEPLPVTGVNTIVAGVRTEKLLARAFQNDEVAAVADEDYIDCRRLCKEVNERISSSVIKGASFTDPDGNVVMPYQSALETFKRNMPEIQAGTARLVSFRLKNGWLADGAGTVTSNAERAANTNDCYKSFINMAVGTDEFYFAGLSRTPRLVSSSRFRDPDGKRLCSAVLVEADIEYLKGDAQKTRPDAEYTVTVRACALPCGLAAHGAAGSLVVHFPQGQTSCISSLRSFIELPSYRQSKIGKQSAANGDYPQDPTAVLVNKESGANVAKAAARGICDWLKTAGSRMRIDNLVEMIDRPFPGKEKALESSVVIYEFDKMGECTARALADGDFARHTVSHEQEISMCNSCARTERGVQGINIRNQVSRAAGKHGGQPRLSLMPVDYSSPSAVEPTEAGNSRTFRQSYLKGGLAVAIEVFFNPDS